MSYNNFGRSRQLMSGLDLGKLKARGVISDDEYAYIEGDQVVAENTKTQDRRVLGRASELLTESNVKRVLNG